MPPLPPPSTNRTNIKEYHDPAPLFLDPGALVAYMFALRLLYHWKHGHCVHLYLPPRTLKSARPKAVV